jgi:hypothetical protein
MSQYLLLKSDGDSDDPRLGLKHDGGVIGGVLGGDNYQATVSSQPENWWNITGDWDGDANELGSVDGFNDVAEFDAAANDSYEDIFTGQFNSTDWPSFFGQGNFVYLAFAAKWDTIPNWENDYPDAEWIRQPVPDPNNYQLYLLRNDANEDSRDEYFRIYYPPSSSAYAEIADPYVWLDWNDLQWDAQIVGTESDRTVEPDLRVDTSSSTFGTSSTGSSSNAIIESAFSTTSDGSLFTSSTILSGRTTADTIVSESTGTSTTLADALRDAFTSSTFGNSSSDTTAGGLTELFTHADQPADLTTSSVVEAFTESFDTVQRTALGDALSTVTGDTTVATTQTIQSLGNALAEPLVASETAALTVQDGDSFADAYVDALRASGSGLPTGAVGDTAVTSLGTAQVATATPQFDIAEVEIFTFVSPESATATPRVGGGETATNAVALTEDAVMVPITPTMDVVIQVRPGQLGVEGQFADSLAASVGASTSIKVAKTVADAEEQTGGVDTSVVPDAIAATAEAIQQSGDGFADSTAEALAVAAALQSFASSSSATDVVGSEGVASATDVDADGFSSATPDAAVRDVVASELDASADTSATSEALAEAAQTLTAEGLADTQAEAAALVAQVAARRQQGGVDTFAGVEGLTEEFESIERVGRPSSFTLSEAAREVFSPEEIDTDALAEALPLISATLVSTVNVNGAASTDATSDGDVTDADMSPVDALLRILFAAIEGSNAAIPITEQNVRVENTQNYAIVEN